jgi:tetratricopeptide (TPR) repeat protein
MVRHVVALLVVLAFAFLAGSVARADVHVFGEAGQAAASAEQAAIGTARAAIAAGHMGDAVTSLELFVKTHPGATAAVRFLGDLYYREGRLAAAEATYEQLLAVDANDKETHNRLGAVYEIEHREPDAIAQFEAALPGTDSVGNLVALHAHEGDLPQFRDELVTRAQKSPGDLDAQTEAGELFDAMHRPQQAIEYFQRALVDDPRSIAALTGLGLAYLDLRRYDLAEQDFAACLAGDPHNYACTDDLGATYLEAGSYEQASRELDAAYGLAPERAETLVNFGYLADARGDWQRAITYYAQAISVDPYSPEAYVNLGIDYEGNNQYAKAESALLKGLAIAPQDGRMRYLLGRAYALQGDLAQAVVQLKAAAASLDPAIAAIAAEESAKLTTP